MGGCWGKQEDQSSKPAGLLGEKAGPACGLSGRLRVHDGTNSLTEY